MVRRLLLVLALVVVAGLRDELADPFAPSSRSGKSTQVPSFILEHDMRMGRDVKIFCTEPRRISAISLAQRVSQELGEAPGACGTRNSYVGYSIRLDSQVSATTRICYATTVRPVPLPRPALAEPVS